MRITIEMYIIGGLALLIGIWLRYYVNKKRFNRRAITGMQLYNSYESAVVTSTFEKILKIIGLILIIAGVLFCYAGYNNTAHVVHHEPEKQHKATPSA